MNIKSNSNIPLENKDIRYKMIIPEKVEKKIRILCREISKVEWSGILFYKTSGSFEKEDLIVTCVDIFPMDIGTSTYTEYYMSADICTYMIDHPELTSPDIFQAHIHSHNVMAAFFSGTDIQELRDSGEDVNHFVSLIVNNDGNYVAKITRRVKVHKDIKEVYSYNTWKNKVVTGETTYSKEEEVLQSFDLDIEKQSSVDAVEVEIKNRLKDIETAKQTPKKTPEFTYSAPSSFERTYFPIVNKANIASKELFPVEDMEDIDYSKVPIEEDVLNLAIKKTITCNFLISPTTTVDLDAWLKSLDKIYSSNFGSIKVFESFASNFADIIVNNTYTGDYYKGDALAFKIVEVLKSYPKNEWLDVWIDVYSDYII